MVTAGMIIDGLHRLGLGPGSIIVVHSSLRSFGFVRGGAETVIAALTETVTREGLVVMPTHTLCMKGRPGVEPFDPKTSTAYTGTIPNVFWRQPEVLRSGHPTHSDAAWGRRAAELLADHESRGPVGVDSPLERVARWGGFILQLGVSHGTNTTLHLAEVLAGVPYVSVSYRPQWGDVALVRRDDGAVVEMAMVNDERPGCSGGFPAIEALLKERGLTRETTIGRCRARLMPAMEMVELAVELLKRDPAALLCKRPNCPHCVEARRTIDSPTPSGE